MQPARGTRDIWGEDAIRFERVISVFRTIAVRYGFSEIMTPVFEFSEVFKRSLGETSDVVSKEMYTFTDRGGEELTLRPENTAGIARAYVSEGMQSLGSVKLFAHGPMFRYERPQKGRFRQFYQLDAEIIGAAEPEADIELIAMGHQILSDLGLLDKVTLHLNSLGDRESRTAYRKALVAFLKKHEADLSEDSRKRLARNPLRILDSKDKGDRGIIADAPVLAEFLNKESAVFIARVKAGLDAMGIAYTEDPYLVRGLDYYCHTAFEFITDGLGAQGTVIGGGRYDGLIEQLGGPAVPGTGWAGGIERLAMLLTDMPARPRPVAIIPIGDAARETALKLAMDFRRAGHAVELSYKGNVKKQFARASKANAHTAIVLGEDEIAAGKATVKNLDTGEQETFPMDGLLAAVPVNV